MRTCEARAVLAQEGMRKLGLILTLAVLLACNRDRIAANDTADQSGANERVVPTESMPAEQATSGTALVPIAGATATSTGEPPKDTAPAPTGDIVAGQKVFRERCASCHGADGKTAAGDFTLASGATQARADAELANAIRKAPSHKQLRLNDGEVNGVVAYVKALQ
jgi:mono/diheme cytochrome c family protein